MVMVGIQWYFREQLVPLDLELDPFSRKFVSLPRVQRAQGDHDFIQFGVAGPGVIMPGNIQVIVVEIIVGSKTWVKLVARLKE